MTRSEKVNKGMIDKVINARRKKSEHPSYAQTSLIAPSD